MWFLQLVIVSHFADFIFNDKEWLIIAYPVISILIAVVLTFVLFRIILWFEIFRLWFIDNNDKNR